MPLLPSKSTGNRHVDLDYSIRVPIHITLSLSLTLTQAFFPNIFGVHRADVLATMMMFDV